MSAYSIKDLKNDFSSFVSEKQGDQIDARSRFFSKCGRYYDANSSPAMKSYLDHDLFLQKAKMLEGFLGNAPDSMKLLNPLKDAYITRWQALRYTLRDLGSPDCEIEKKVFSLVIAHKHFVRGFIQEVKKTQKDRSEAAEMNHPKTLKLLYQTVCHTAPSHSDKWDEMRALFETADPSLFDSVPYPGNPNDLKPTQGKRSVSAPPPVADSAPPQKESSEIEIWSLIGEKMPAWREDYAALNKLDQDTLLNSKTFFKNQDNTSKLSQEAEALFVKICQTLYDARNQDWISSTALSSAFFQFIVEDFTLASSLRQSCALNKISREISDEDALQFLRDLPLENTLYLKMCSDLGFYHLIRQI